MSIARNCHRCGQEIYKKALKSGGYALVERSGRRLADDSHGRLREVFVYKKHRCEALKPEPGQCVAPSVDGGPTSLREAHELLDAGVK